MKIEYINADGLWQFDIQASEFNLLLQTESVIYNKSQGWFEVIKTTIKACRTGGYINITD